MDWARAIEINQTALTRIVATLIAMVGLAAQGAVARLPRPLYRRALSILRPAESAVRRLIVIAARGVAVKPHALRPMPKGLALARVGAAAAPAPAPRFSCSILASVSAPRGGAEASKQNPAFSFSA